MTVYELAAYGESVHHVWDEDLADWAAQPPSPEVIAVHPNLMISPAPASLDCITFQENWFYKTFQFWNASSDSKEKNLPNWAK